MREASAATNAASWPVAPATKTWKRYKVGDIVSVRISGADAHDLWGELA